MSNRIPQAFIDEVLARVDIVELIQSRIQLKKAGKDYQANCPFHNEKTPSFTVSPSKQFFYCFGCKATGNAIGFLMQYERMEFSEAIETLAACASMPMPETFEQQQQQQYGELYTLLSKTNQYYQTLLQRNKAALHYLSHRGLSSDIIKRFQIGFAPDSWDSLRNALGKTPEKLQQLLQTGMIIKSPKGSYYDRFRQRIMFPIFDVRGRIIGFGGRALGGTKPKYLNSPETSLFHKSQALYGLFQARQNNKKLEQIIMVEGYMDVIALAQYNIYCAVATLGTATTRQHLQQLFRYTPSIVFCFDGDTAGQQAAWRALVTALPLMRDGLNLAFMFLPQGEDPDSLVRKLGEKQFLMRVAKATPLANFFFQQLERQTQAQGIAGKAQLAKQAMTLLGDLPNGVFKQLIIDKLAAQLNLSQERLTSLMVKEESLKTLTTGNKRQTTSPIRTAIALLLQQPELAQQVQSIHQLANYQEPGVPTLYQLLQQLKQNPNLTTATLLERWRHTKQASVLAQLAAKDLLIPSEGRAEELSGALNRIHIRQRDKLIKELLNKANQISLTTTEKQQLQQLLLEKEKMT